jgi:hypothetical protein
MPTSFASLLCVTSCFIPARNRAGATGTSVLPSSSTAHDPPSARCRTQQSPILLALCALLALAIAFVGPAHAQEDSPLQPLPIEDNGSAACGTHQVQWQNQPPPNFQVPGSATLQATAPDGQPIVELYWPLAPGEKVIPLWCGDLLGDGRQALAYEFFSGGAHCCFTATVLILEPGAPHLLDADLGNGGLIQPNQLDTTRPIELPATSDVFAYFDDLSFAASPFLPLVFAYDGAQYVEATRRFPDLIAAQVAQTEADLASAIARQVPAPSRFDYQEQESIALRLYALHVLLGDADQALPLIQAQVSPPVAAWLTANKQAALDALGHVYNLGGDSLEGRW